MSVKDKKIPVFPEVPCRLQPRGYAFAQLLFGASYSKKPKSTQPAPQPPISKVSKKKVPHCSL